MICLKCDENLRDCKCPDLKERLEKISNLTFVHIGEEYKQQIAAQAKKNLEQQTIQE